jgi:hypothetical protein
LETAAAATAPKAAAPSDGGNGGMIAAGNVMSGGFTGGVCTTPPLPMPLTRASRQHAILGETDTISADDRRYG